MTFHLKPSVQTRMRILAVLVGLLCAGAVLADRSDHERARQALERGDVLPLRTILDRVESEYPGQVLEIEFEYEDRRYFYEVRILQKDGRIAKLKVDAVDGRVLEIKRKAH